MAAHSNGDSEQAHTALGYVGDTAFLKMLETEVEANLRNNQFGVQELARKVGLSRSQVHRKLKTISGQSISQFIREYRLRKALELLKADGGSASDIAYAVGFSSPSYFNRCFTEQYGISPGEAKKAEVIKESVPVPEPPPGQFKVNPMPIVIGLFLIGLIGILLLNDDEAVPPTMESSPSIAVLPFKDLNEDDTYFSNGTMDAILASLAEYDELRVISRTSVEQYRNTIKTIPQIARELEVSHLLEGSVQRNGSQVRIIVQLIRASDDAHLWAKTYDREVTDVFAIQSEIAQLVAEELKGEITDSQMKGDVPPTDSFEAYELYLRGTQYHQNYFYRRNERDLRLAEDYYDQALTLDQDFLNPWIGKGWVLVDRVRWLAEDPMLLDSALALASQLNSQYPNHSKVLTLLGTVHRYRGGNRFRARSALIQAVDLNPGNTWALELLAWYFAVEENRIDLALVLHERALSRDPFNAGLLEAMGWHWANLGEYVQATEYYLRALDQKPDNIGARQGLARVKILQNGNYEGAFEELEKALDYSPRNISIYHDMGRFSSWKGDFEASEGFFDLIREMTPGNEYVSVANALWLPGRYAYTLWNRGQQDEARRYFQMEIDRDKQLLHDSIGHGGFSPYYDLASVSAFLGRSEEAFGWLDQIIPSQSWGDPHFIKEDPLFDPIKPDPRFEVLITSWEERLTSQQSNYEKLRKIEIEELIRDPEFGKTVSLY